ncbi:phosphatase PAP2 family protein [Taibaiella soli]|uniref:Phosphatidic acid phosphatase type 2/haloperoxidase domain-containing protein n=1 Tax=Taibaiella soli TaxID=1649169 RepID=A0A2W2A8M8_9BACT|nr:phosphatase PAP2 family protein [Taibaiella soli]PZF71631.1 hypothetical protein DN068_16295 [Taibaiella soli]
MMVNLYDYDLTLLRLIHHSRITALDMPLYWLSFVNTFVSIGILLFLLFLSFKRRAILPLFLKILTVFLISALMVWLIKNIMFRQRPFITYTDIQKLSEAGSASFPSGHTTEAFAMAFAISFLSGRWWLVLLVYTWALLVAYSRIALGVHYPSDVLGGMVLGTFIAFITLKLTNRLQWKRKMN